MSVRYHSINATFPPPFLRFLSNPFSLCIIHFLFVSFIVIIHFHGLLFRIMHLFHHPQSSIYYFLAFPTLIDFLLLELGMAQNQHQTESCRSHTSESMHIRCCWSNSVSLFHRHINSFHVCIYILYSFPPLPFSYCLFYNSIDIHSFSKWQMVDCLATTSQ